MFKPVSLSFLHFIKIKSLVQSVFHFFKLGSLAAMQFEYRMSHPVFKHLISYNFLI